MRDWELIYKTILNNEYLTLKQIQIITGKGEVTATRIRNEIRESVYRRGKEMDNEQTPTHLLLEHIGKDEDYFYEKLVKSLDIQKRLLEIEKLEGEINANNN